MRNTILKNLEKAAICKDIRVVNYWPL
jgi:hypothetical protein